MRTYLVGLAVTATIAFSMITTQVHAFERWLDIVNYSSWTINEFYMSHVDSSDWGPDLFESYVLHPGEELRVDPGFQQGYCMLDWLAVWEDGETSTGVINACEETTLSFYD